METAVVVKTRTNWIPQRCEPGPFLDNPAALCMSPVADLFQNEDCGSRIGQCSLIVVTAGEIPFTSGCDSEDSLTCPKLLHGLTHSYHGVVVSMVTGDALGCCKVKNRYISDLR